MVNLGKDVPSRKTTVQRRLRAYRKKARKFGGEVLDVTSVAVLALAENVGDIVADIADCFDIDF
jgi:hypothetical protein